MGIKLKPSYAYVVKRVDRDWSIHFCGDYDEARIFISSYNPLTRKEFEIVKVKIEQEEDPISEKNNS